LNLIGSTELGGLIICTCVTFHRNSRLF